MSNSPPNIHKITIKDLLFTPIGCLLKASPVFIFILLALAYFAWDYVYNNVNINLFGVGAPDYQQLSIDSGFYNIKDSNQDSWKIEYDYTGDSTFSGLVRHVSPIRLSQFPMLSHDILVTTEDFSNPSIVTTDVSDHHFSWINLDNATPKGTINLLHTVPLNMTIYQQLLKIQNGTKVKIIGREILRINAYDPNGNRFAWWEDNGCNSILVKSVTIIN
ncbi:MAG TPA: hypothetical protein VKF38_01200 [Anaerolineaceae bacterium]|nr:hypothetical protein [Anaerolineaceae bacterium]